MNSCEHLQNAVDPDPTAEAGPDDGCPDCLAQGFHGWVHLRICLSCGYIGCCDSSPYRHATRHFEGTSHPVMRSYEPGERWRWCFVDQRIG